MRIESSDNCDIIDDPFAIRSFISAKNNTL